MGRDLKNMIAPVQEFAKNPLLCLGMDFIAQNLDIPEQFNEFFDGFDEIHKLITIESWEAHRLGNV